MNKNMKHETETAMIYVFRDQDPPNTLYRAFGVPIIT